MRVKAKLTFLDNWSAVCTGTRATLLHLSLRSSSSIRHRVFQGYPISSRQKSIPGPWDRPSINSGGRNMGQPPELKPPPHPTPTPPHLPLPAQHKVNELTTFPLTSSNQQQRPPSNVSALKVAVMFQSRPWFTQTHLCTHVGVCGLTGAGTNACTCMVTSTGSMHGCCNARTGNTCSLSYLQSLFLFPILSIKKKKIYHLVIWTRQNINNFDNRLIICVFY